MIALILALITIPVSLITLLPPIEKQRKFDFALDLTLEHYEEAKKDTKSLLRTRKIFLGYMPLFMVAMALWAEF